MNVFPLPELVYIPIHDWIEDDTAIVIKQDAAWQALQPRDLDWDIGIALEAPAVATEQSFDRLIDQSEDMGDIVYAIGGGVAVDAAKYVAKALELPLVSVPTALSADAFFTWASGIRRDGVVRYVEAIPPEIILLDLDVIARAPQPVRAAGIIDVLSIATGCWDWKLGDQLGKNLPGERYDANVEAVAKSIMQIALDAAGAAGAGEADGLRSLVNALAMEVQLCNLVGHSRLEEGSEHHFAYCAEALAGGDPSVGSSESSVGRQGGAAPTSQPSSQPTSHTHGELVGPGIVLMAERQGQDAAPLRRALEAAGVPLNALPQELIEATLRALPGYVRKHDLPYGIAWELGQ